MNAMNTRSLYELFDSITDYVDNYCISYDGLNIHINVTFLSYDLIDKNLDFDEEYYVRLLSNIMEMLQYECKQIMHTCETETIKVVQSLKLMKSYTILQSKIKMRGNTVKATTYKTF